ncbi:MAG: HD domain-containing protein [Candidatus Omnitrophica bacterium]|nr:HD domain-containing protein [Candidatus Omnitrophota bacterium]
MPRLIDIITNNLTRRNKAVPEKGVSQTGSETRDAGGGMISRDIDPGPKESPGQIPEPSDRLILLYNDGLAVAESVIAGVVGGADLDGASVTNLAEKVVEEFIRDTCNSLLLCSYYTSKNDYLSSHLVNDVILSVAFGVSLGFGREDISKLAVASFLHDLGMIADSGLRMVRGKLKDKEFSQIKKHPIVSTEIAKKYFNDDICRIVIEVHERVDGKGYPYGKMDRELSPLSVLLSISDVFESLTHPRAFRERFSAYESLKMIISMGGRDFNNALIRDFINFTSVYPIGSLAYLNTGDICMVVARSPENNPMRPMVKIVVNNKRQVVARSTVIDLAKNQLMYLKGPIKKSEEEELVFLVQPRGFPEIFRY